MSEIEKIRWRHVLVSVLSVAIVAGISVYCDQIVHTKGEMVRYSGDDVRFGVGGCEMKVGERGRVMKSGVIYEDGVNMSANWILSESGCEVVIESGQLEE